MLWIFFQMLLFGILIWIGHMGYNYVKDSTTHKKTKDLVNPQIEKYKQLLDEAFRRNQTQIQTTPFLLEEPGEKGFEFGNIDQNMEEELSIYLQQCVAQTSS